MTGKYPSGYDIRLYRIWRSIKQRCHYAGHQAYHRYGGRGIRMCDEWRRSYAAFAAWALANGYADDLTTDRIDNNKGYEPGNCRFATYVQQHHNRRDNLPLVAAFGETKSIVDWARDQRCVVNKGSLTKRIAAGRPPEWAITAPPRSDRKKRAPPTQETKDKIRATLLSKRVKVGNQ
jgi:hypothetical protein